MNYFTAGLYGDYQAYKKITSLLGPDDKLWILGDVLDGNSEHPEDCLKILDDIQFKENITLVLGDHEYFHAMRMFAEVESEDEEEESVWLSEIEGFEYPGDALVHYMKEFLTKDEIMNYANFLASLDVSDITMINNRIFYLCHGAPSRMEDKETRWQCNVVTGNIDFFKSYNMEMESDIRINYFAKNYNIQRSQMRDAIVIAGHNFTPNLENDGEEIEDGIVFSNRIMCINSGASADNKGVHIVVGIDNAGWQTIEIGGDF